MKQQVYGVLVLTTVSLMTLSLCKLCAIDYSSCGPPIESASNCEELHDINACLVKALATAKCIIYLKRQTYWKIALRVDDKRRTVKCEVYPPRLNHYGFSNTERYPTCIDEIMNCYYLFRAPVGTYKTQYEVCKEHDRAIRCVGKAFILNCKQDDTLLKVLDVLAGAIDMSRMSLHCHFHLYDYVKKHTGPMLHARSSDSKASEKKQSSNLMVFLACAFVAIVFRG